ncbi:MAG: hypothetical protein R3293_18005, partial [Candidatus Promineifilaceae bacterium]|nr:hypothetical protein [Candidatus Promineifilaceae bacterium]
GDSDIARLGESIRGRLDKATAYSEMYASRLDSQMDDALGKAEIDIQLEERGLKWSGSIKGHETVTTTVTFTHTAHSEPWVPVTAIIDDRVTNPLIIHDLKFLPPLQYFLPVLAVN